MFRSNIQRTGVYNTTGIRQLKGLKWKFDRSNLAFIFDYGLTVADGIVCLGNWDGNLYGLDFQTGKKVWHYRVGETWVFNINIFNSSTVADGLVYISSYQINKNTEKIATIDLKTGREKWQFEIAIESTASANNFVSASVAVVDRVVYFGSIDGNLYSIDAISGDRIGYFRTTKNMPLSTPAIKDNIVYVYSSDGYLYAIDIATQKQLWKFEIGGTSSAYSIVPVIANNKVYVVVNSKIMYAIDLETGLESWHFTAEKASLSQPAISDRFVCIVNNSKDLYALDPETGEEIWTRSLTNFASYFPAYGPIVADNIIYLSGMGCLTAMDLETKEQLWEFKPESTDVLQPKFWLDLGSETWKIFTGDYASFDLFSAPIIADGVIYVGSSYGYLYALEGV